MEHRPRFLLIGRLAYDITVEDYGRVGCHHYVFLAHFVYVLLCEVWLGLLAGYILGHLHCWQRCGVCLVNVGYDPHAVVKAQAADELTAAGRVAC